MTMSFISFALPAVFLGVQAQAASITASTFFGAPGIAEVGQFDPSNGLLTSAVLSIDAIAERASGHVCSGTETITDETNLSVMLLGRSFQDTAEFSYECQGAGDIFEIILQASIDAAEPLLTSDFAAITGPGTVQATVDNNGFFAIGEIRLTYTFTPVADVSLPAGGALLLTALGALGIRRHLR